jgi:D-glycerate 3-kinase
VEGNAQRTAHWVHLRHVFAGVNLGELNDNFSVQVSKPSSLYKWRSLDGDPMAMQTELALSLRSLLHRWTAGADLALADLEHMRQILLADSDRAAAFGITPETVDVALDRRLRLFFQLYPEFSPFCQTQLGWSETLVAERLETFWNLWLPLALHLADQRAALDRPWMQGILGGQGTGKTTLTAILTWILAQLNYRVCGVSIDDLYKTYTERQRLQQFDPRLRWRGPPGTHDVSLGLSVLQQLRHWKPGQTVAIPRFDKSLWGGAGDRTLPEHVSQIDIVLFEGWFVGARPVDPALFDSPQPLPEPINTRRDRQFARDINEALADYVPLWEQLDALMVLAPVDYHLSQQWRREAEQQMRASGKSGMSDAEIDEFVTYFWRSLHPDLFIAPLCQQAGYADLVIEIDTNHAPSRVYIPGYHSEQLL